MNYKSYYDFLMEAADKNERRKRFNAWVTLRCRAALLDHQRRHSRPVAAVSTIDSIYDAAPEPDTTAVDPSHAGSTANEC